MKNKTNPITHLTIITVFVFLSLGLVSCQAAANPTPAGEAADVRPTDAPAGGVDLTSPVNGLSGLSSYRQQFDLTLQGSKEGSSVETRQTITRNVLGSDEMVSVNQTGTDDVTLEFVEARLGAYHYTQDRPGVSCRAEAAQAGEEKNENPAARLPAVYGMQEADREMVDDQTVVHYTFNEHSLVDKDGVVKSATGEVWLAEESGAVIKYHLTVEINSKEFSGTRTWAYQLDQVNQIEAISLPEACQPVLADLPTLPDAANLVVMPGFQRYSAPATRAEAVSFYNEQLPPLGWQPLPGSTPEKVDRSSAVTVLSFAQEVSPGSRLLVLRLAEKDGQLQVIAQTARTKQTIDTTSVSQGADVGGGGQPPRDPPSGESVGIPPDFLLYPDATILVQNTSVILLKTQDSPTNVVDFYRSELEGEGWKLDQESENAGVYLLMISSGEANLAISVMTADGGTQITISAVSE